MAGMLLGEWDGHLGNLAQALAVRDPVAVRLHAHTLKSLVAMFHAEGARRRSLEIEQAVMAENLDWLACEAGFAALRDEMARIRPHLQAFVETRVMP